MGLIWTAVRGVAKMVKEDVGFEEVRDEFGLLEVFRTSRERLRMAMGGEKEDTALPKTDR
jgi:hypothetical protein